MILQRSAATIARLGKLMFGFALAHTLTAEISKMQDDEFSALKDKELTAADLTKTKEVSKLENGRPADTKVSEGVSDWAKT